MRLAGAVQLFNNNCAVEYSRVCVCTIAVLFTLCFCASLKPFVFLASNMSSCRNIISQMIETFIYYQRYLHWFKWDVTYSFLFNQILMYCIYRQLHLYTVLVYRCIFPSYVCLRDFKSEVLLYFWYIKITMQTAADCRQQLCVSFSSNGTASNDL